MFLLGSYLVKVLRHSTSVLRNTILPLNKCASFTLFKKLLIGRYLFHYNPAPENHLGRNHVVHVFPCHNLFHCDFRKVLFDTLLMCLQYSPLFLQNKFYFLNTKIYPLDKRLLVFMNFFYFFRVVNFLIVR